MSEDDKLFVTIADLKQENCELQRELSKYWPLAQLAEVIVMLQGVNGDLHERYSTRSVDARCRIEELERRNEVAMEELGRARAQIAGLEQTLDAVESSRLRDIDKRLSDGWPRPGPGGKMAP